MQVGKEPKKTPVGWQVSAVGVDDGAKPVLHEGVDVLPARTVTQPALPLGMAGQAQKTGAVVVVLVVFLVVRTVVLRVVFAALTVRARA